MGKPDHDVECNHGWDNYVTVFVRQTGRICLQAVVACGAAVTAMSLLEYL
jgi:hypothetical protein